MDRWHTRIATELNCIAAPSKGWSRTNGVEPGQSSWLSAGKHAQRPCDSGITDEHCAWRERNNRASATNFTAGYVGQVTFFPLFIVLLVALVWLQVRQWREDCQLRQQEANRQAKLLLDKQVAAVRNEWERERERREGIKEELQAHFAMRVRQQEEEVLHHRRMVWEQQSCLAKQTARNSERCVTGPARERPVLEVLVCQHRVEYRSSLMEVRKQEQTDRQERKYQERQKMEEHLEQLRSIVRKEASSDLDRTCGDTEVSIASTTAVTHCFQLWLLLSTGQLGPCPGQAWE